MRRSVLGGATGVPLVSVIIPTYNRAGPVQEAIASVQAQLLTDWELIVVDDGSTDDTPKVLDALVAGPGCDPRIRVIHKLNGGAGAARNTGLAAARTPFVAFLDSDNLFYPAFLASAVRALGADGALSGVYGGLVTRFHRPPDMSVFL